MTTAFMPRTVVDGPTRVPLPYGLFSVFAPQPGERWQAGGVTWEALSCDPLGGVGQPLCPPEETVGRTKDLAALNTDVGEASPFTVYGHHTCSPVGSRADAYPRAVEHLEAREQQAVEAALWTGDLGNVPNFAAANGYPAITSAGSFDVTEIDEAVAELEAAYAAAYGSLGVLHMSRRHAALLRGVTERSGRLLTRLGTPIVAGAGYGRDAIVATGQLFGYRSEVFPGDIGAGGFDTAQNDYTALAERTYLIGFDPCGARRVTITDSEG